jgi:phosphatidylglycerophosphate synthase
MIDRYLQPIMNTGLRPIARGLIARGVTADQITLAGFGVGLAAVLALAVNLPLIGLGLIALNRIMDGLDGAVARQSGPTDRGAFLDIAADFLFYALVPLGFAFADPAQNALAAAILIAAFVGTGSSFLAFAAIAAKQGRRADDYPTKGIYYVGGLTEGAETIAVFAAMCLWPDRFATLAILFATLCAVTTATRWHRGWHQLNSGPTTKRTSE